MVSRPTGTVTFLLTDVEGSTRAWEAHPDSMAEAMARHDAILRGTIETLGGYVFSTAGDAPDQQAREPDTEGGAVDRGRLTA